MRSAWMCLCPSATKIHIHRANQGRRRTDRIFSEAIMVAHVGPSAWRQPRCRQPKQYHVRECASSGTAEVTSSYHCLEKSILPSDSPVGSTPIGDLSVVRVLRVCGWLHGRRRPVHATPGRARGRRRWKLAECDAKERRRSNCPALLCLFGVIAFASKLVGVWMSTLDESQPPGAARHASISCSLWELNYMRKRERERERDERERSCAAIERSMDRTNKLRLSVICHRGGNNQPSLLCSHFLRGDSLASFRPKQHHSTTRTSGGSKQFLFLHY